MRKLELPVRFVAFANEEPPYFPGKGMGSAQYVAHFNEAPTEIKAMLSLESVGFYSDASDSQQYPPLVGWFYPDQGNFIAFVGELSARALVREVVGLFRANAELASEGAALPGWIDGVSWSDHRSFSAVGVPALMVTDTAPFRNPHYHEATDTPEKLDYERMARLVEGLVQVIARLANLA
jgi:hypothetical protein